MRPRLQITAIHCILVKARPFFKRLSSLLLILVGVPFQHALVVFDADALAEGFDNELGAVEEVVGVDDADVDARMPVGMAVRVAICVAVGVAVGAAVGSGVAIDFGTIGRVCCNLWSNLANRA